MINNDLTQLSADISDVWNGSTVYAVGDYCIYNNTLWKCKVQNSNVTPTEGTYWTAVTVGEEITSINSRLTHKEQSMFDTIRHENDGFDINEFKQGMAICNNIDNCPTTGYCYVYAFGHYDERVGYACCVQIANSFSDYKTYIRFNWNNAWGAWKEI